MESIIFHLTTLITYTTIMFKNFIDQTATIVWWLMQRGTFIMYKLLTKYTCFTLKFSNLFWDTSEMSKTSKYYLLKAVMFEKMPSTVNYQKEVFKMESSTDVTVEMQLYLATNTTHTCSSLKKYISTHGLNSFTYIGFLYVKDLSFRTAVINLSEQLEAAGKTPLFNDNILSAQKHFYFP